MVELVDTRDLKSFASLGMRVRVPLQVPFNKEDSVRAGEVKIWLDQGPAVLLAQCEVEAEALTPQEFMKKRQKMEKGWVISLLQTGEILTVHEDTLVPRGSYDRL